MSDIRHDLFKWQRTSKEPRTYNSKQSLRSQNDISDWLNRVEQRVAVVNPAQNELPPAATTSNVNSHEAQLLLREWTAKKDADFEELLLGERDLALREEVRKACSSDDNQNQQVQQREKSPSSKQTAFDADLERDLSPRTVTEITRAESLLSQQIVSDLMARKVPNNGRPKSGKSSDRAAANVSARNTSNKVDARIAKAKEAREQREAERKKQVEDRQRSQDIRDQARELLAAEEREKADALRREEQLIHEEMKKIRARYDQQRLGRVSKRVPLRDDSVTKGGGYKSPATTKQSISPRVVQATPAASDADKPTLLARVTSARNEKVEENTTAKATAERVEELWRACQVRLLRRGFTAWRSIVFTARLQHSKASSFAEFQLLRRFFGKLRRFARDCRAQRELDQERADRHFAQQTLRKCFFAIRQAANESISERLTSQIEEQRRQRASHFLQQLSSQQEEPNEPTCDEKNQSDRRFSKQKSSSVAKQGRWDRLAEPRNPNPVRRRRGSKCETETQTEAAPDPVSTSASERCDGENGALPRNLVQIFETRQRSHQRVLAEQTRLIKEQKQLIDELRNEQRAAQQQQQLAREKLEADLFSKFSQLVTKVATPVRTETDVQVQETVTGGETEKNDKKDVVSAAKGPDLAKRLEQRAAERQRLRLERDERRRRAEIERQLAEKLAEAERERAEAEELARRAAEARERKRLELQKEEARAKELLRLEVLSQQAEEHWLRSLKTRVFVQWRNYVLISVPNRISIFHTMWQHRLLRRVITAWHGTVSHETTVNNQKSEAFRKEILLRRHFKAWSDVKKQAAVNVKVADSWYRQALVGRSFVAWRNYTAGRQERDARSGRLADDHRTSQLLRRTFAAWKRLPEIEKAERQRVARITMMRQKVMEVLPDFSKA